MLPLPSRRPPPPLYPLYPLYPAHPSPPRQHLSLSVSHYTGRRNRDAAGGNLRKPRIRFNSTGALVRVLAVIAIAALFATWLAAHRKLRWPLVTTVAAAPPTPAAQGPTVIDVSPVVLREHVLRLGMNLGDQNNYNGQQILKNLINENPGFEGFQWQTVLQCGQAAPDSCTDAGNSGAWPEGFLDGGTYEVLTGAAAGQTGPILHSTGATGQHGATIQFPQTGKPLAKDDFIAVRKDFKGDADGGWGKYVVGGATVATEFKDLSPRTPGAQALRIDASAPNQFVALAAGIDTTGSRSYVQLRGQYRIRFRAKALKGNRSIVVNLQRAGSPAPLVDRTVPLSGDWQDYTLDFQAQESRQAVGNLLLKFSVFNAELLLDDVSLEEATSNGTVFRDDVVATLQRLRPGVLRYMDSGQNFGSSLDNMLAPPMARRRCGFNRYATSPSSVPIGLHDFLVLSEKLGTEPWYTMQLGMSAQEAADLMEYLGGPVTTKYGAARAALGHPVPWTQTFPRIHLEFGNEAWNTAQPGATMPGSPAYAARANLIFGTVRASKWFSPGGFNLIANTQAVWDGRTIDLLQTLRQADTLDIGPYLFNTFADDSSIEHIFGPMFAQPQFLDSSVDGYDHLQAHAAATAEHPVRLAVYEVNLGTTSGTASQASIDATVPSVGAGIAVIEHELLMLRDLGITVQNTFQLGGGDYPFDNTADKSKHETTPLWGVVLDMGGATGRVRPVFLAQQLVNQAIRSNMLTTSIAGDNPTWNQPHTPNGNFAWDKVRELQSFAFADAGSTSLVVVNLSRTSPRTVGLRGACAPSGHVTVQTLTSAKITDSNELQENVKTLTREEPNVVPGTSVFTLPPFSITSFSSSNAGCVPSR